MNGETVARLERLEAIDEIRTLKHTYMAICDLGYPPDKLGPLFTEDAVWTSETLGHARGRAQIQAFFADVPRMVSFSAHLALNGIVTVDGDTGTGEWRLLMPCTFIEDGRKVARWMLGDYHEKYRRQNGKWLFSRIDFFVNFNVPAADGWAGLEKIRTL